MSNRFKFKVELKQQPTKKKKKKKKPIFGLCKAKLRSVDGTERYVQPRVTDHSKRKKRRRKKLSSPIIVSDTEIEATQQYKAKEEEEEQVNQSYAFDMRTQPTPPHSPLLYDPEPEQLQLKILPLNDDGYQHASQVGCEVITIEDSVDAASMSEDVFVVDDGARDAAVDALIDVSALGHEYQSTQLSPQDSQQQQRALSMASNFEIPLADLQIGSFIGKGHYGRIFDATWQGGTRVAAKTMRAFAKRYGALRSAEAERRRRCDAENELVRDEDAELALVRRRDELAADVGAMMRAFRREVEILCQLRHPNVLLYLGAVVEPPNLILVTELMALGSLFDVLHTTKRSAYVALDYNAKLGMMLDVACGMNYLHRRSVLHRDLKSPNLLVARHLQVKVSDFGLARFSRSFEARARGVNRVSALDVRIQAPEVLASRERLVYSPKSDVYSFALLLWEVAERRVPYPHLDAKTVAKAVLRNRLRPPLPSGISAEYTDLIELCWQQDADKRPEFAQIVAHLLKMKSVEEQSRAQV